jgi:hypothetical protein
MGKPGSTAITNENDNQSGEGGQAGPARNSIGGALLLFWQHRWRLLLQGPPGPARTGPPGPPAPARPHRPTRPRGPAWLLM